MTNIWFCTCGLKEWWINSATRQRSGEAQRGETWAESSSGNLCVWQSWMGIKAGKSCQTNIAEKNKWAEACWKKRLLKRPLYILVKMVDEIRMSEEEGSPIHRISCVGITEDLQTEKMPSSSPFGEKSSCLLMDNLKQKKLREERLTKGQTCWEAEIETHRMGRH